MTGSYRAVAGRVTQSDDQGPIHGLLIKLVATFGSHWEKDEDCAFDLGCDLTNREGRYWIGIDSDRFTEACKCKGHLQFCIEVLDRDGHEIHSECRKTLDCPPDTIFQFDVRLRSEDLECHLGRPLSWDCPEEPLLPDWVADDIEEALEILGKEAAHGPPAPPNLLQCAKPVLAIFGDVLRDACKTVDGDLDAAKRFRDAMDAICAYHSDSCCGDESSPHLDAVEDILTEACEVDPCKPVKLERKTACCEEPACPDRELLVSHEKVAILVMAALHVSCGHLQTARTYLVAILDQICRFQFLTALHRAAVDTICDEPSAAGHFQDLLELLACHCTPTTQSARHARLCDAIPCCDICVDAALLDCIRDAYRNWCAIGCYKVTHIVPRRACPGDKIVICGCGFGDEPGRVRFVEKGGTTLGPAVDVESWSDERISVVVPEHAGCGLMLLFPIRTINVCDRFLDYRQTGSMLEVFEGTNAQILKLGIKGHQNDDCVLPGEVLKIRWKTCAADHVVVRIVNAETGAVIAELDPAPARGRWDFEDTDFNKTTRVRVVIVASGKCTPPTVSRDLTLTFQKPPNLSIDGVEVTQAIQYYRAASHLTDPADRGPDNSLQLVAEKSAWVRAYLRSGQDPNFDMGQLANVSGTMTVERRVGGIWSVVANLVPVNAPVTAQDSFASYDAERSAINASLNFVVPASVMTGLLRFTISASSPDDCYGGVATSVQQVNVDLDQELRIAAVAVGYNGPPVGGGPDVNFPAPTAAQIAAEANYSLRVYPVRSTPDIRIIDTQNATQPLNNNVPAGGCDANWTPILTMVANARTNDGNQAGWFYYGFVTASMPRSHGNVGCASGLNGAGLLGTGTTLAHEIGHQAGLKHAPCGAVGTVQAGFPLYEPYDTGVTSTNTNGDTVYQDASIGEYGLDVNDGTIYNPNPVRPNNGKDLMSYCGNRWVSLFLHTYMVSNTSLNPVVLATGVSGAGGGAGIGDTRLEDEVRPFITLLGTVSRQGEVAVTSLVRVPTRELTMTGDRTDYVAELIGEDGEVASSAPVFTMPAHEGMGCGCGDKAQGRAQPPFAFIAALADVTEGSAVRIRKGEEVVWERTRPRKGLAVGDVRASVRKDGIHVSWKFEKKSVEEPEVWLRWSEDGRTWNGIAVGLTGTSITLDPATIPARKAMIQVVAHDGFRSVSAESKMIELPETPPGLAILHPGDGQRFYPGDPLHLWGTALGEAKDLEPSWFIDGEEVATGFDAWTTVPDPGEYKIELRAEGVESTGLGIVVAQDRYDRPK